ncbi:MAG: TonB-dependent receptor [Porphyromonas sp.]|nr:TonB-dependent receptor [Porphyromonas sp.]
MRKIVTFISLFLLLSYIATAQNVEITGKVTDAMQEPLTGVRVVIKGEPSRGAITDLDGEFKLQGQRGEVLQFSLIGMQTVEATYEGTPLFIVMHDDTETLNELVVIGYQTIKKADLTGAVSVFNVDELKNKPVTGTIGDALAGLPGLSVRTSGQPGAEGKVEIRGTGTFGNSNPLYVVDGVVSGANRDFNFNDVESIQVLKDASAAAIYGSRAGNGVIIITTKKGKEGKMNIDVSSQLTMQWLPKHNLVGRDRWIELNDMAFRNAGKDPANHNTANTDWQAEAFKMGYVNDHNIALSGGGQNSRYFISGNFQNNTGATIGTKSDRYTFRVNTSASRDFGDLRFTIGENMALSYFRVDELNTNPVLDVIRMLPTIPVFDPENPLGGYGYGDSAKDVTFGVNPFAREEFENTTNSNIRIRGNAFTELSWSDKVKYRMNLGVDASNNKYLYLRKVGNWSYNQPIDPSSLNRNQSQSQEIVFDNTIEYADVIGKHDISVVAGSSYQTFSHDMVWGRKNDVIKSGDQYFTQLDAAMGNPTTGSWLNQSKLFSLFARANYTYDNKYLFSFTVRRDASSKFNPEKRVGYFPSVSGGWRISEEDFFSNDVVNELKLRANYGVLGTSNIGFYDYIPLIENNLQVIFGDNGLQPGMTQVKLVNENLTWERLSQTNIGVDLGMLNNKLTITADYFNKVTHDVLTAKWILNATGNNGGNPTVNAATLRNTGAELTIGWKDNLSETSGYSINLNTSYIKNEVVKVGNYDEKGEVAFNQWDTKTIIGNPIGEWYLIKTDGIFQTKEEVLAHKTKDGRVIQPNARPGDLRYVDANGDGMITDQDRQYSGQTVPKWHVGGNIGAWWNGFDVQVQFTGAFGHKIFNGVRSTIDRFDDNSNYRADYDPWTPENTGAKDPRPLYGDDRNARGDQDRWLEPGGYLKIRQMALGYTLPENALGGFFKSVRFYVNAQNMITFTRYTGLDPEFLNGNIWDRSYDGGAFPNPKAVTFGTRIEF